jgi:hypothetical protein
VSDDIRDQNELTLRTLASQAAELSQNYARQAQLARDLGDEAEPGAVELSERAEMLYLEQSAKWQQWAENPPTDKLLDRNELWENFIRRANEWELPEPRER